MWNVLERYFESVKHFQTAFGHFWYVNMYVFRLFVILVVGEELYDDEQSAFKFGEVGLVVYFSSNVFFSIKLSL